MKLVSPYAEDREVPLIGRTVTPGEVVDVVGRDSVAQLERAGWKRVTPPKPRKPKSANDADTPPVVTDDTNTNEES